MRRSFLCLKMNRKTADMSVMNSEITSTIDAMQSFIVKWNIILTR